MITKDEATQLRTMATDYGNAMGRLADAEYALKQAKRDRDQAEGNVIRVRDKMRACIDRLTAPPPASTS